MPIFQPPPAAGDYWGLYSGGNYFGPNYWGPTPAGGPPPPPAPGDYWGLYSGGSYFGPNYWGPTPGAVGPPPPPAIPFLFGEYQCAEVADAPDLGGVDPEMAQQVA